MGKVGQANVVTGEHFSPLGIHPRVSGTFPAAEVAWGGWHSKSRVNHCRYWGFPAVSCLQVYFRRAFKQKVKIHRDAAGL